MIGKNILPFLIAATASTALAAPFCAAVFTFGGAGGDVKEIPSPGNGFQFFAGPNTLGSIRNGNILLADVASNQGLDPIAIDGFPADLAQAAATHPPVISQKKDAAYFAVSGHLFKIDMAAHKVAGQATYTFDRGAHDDLLKISPDGRFLIVASHQGPYKIFRTSDLSLIDERTELDTLAGSRPQEPIVFSADSRYAIFLGRPSRVYDLEAKSVNQIGKISSWRSLLGGGDSSSSWRQASFMNGQGKILGVTWDGDVEAWDLAKRSVEGTKIKDKNVVNVFPAKSNTMAILLVHDNKTGTDQVVARDLAKGKAADLTGWPEMKATVYLGQSKDEGLLFFYDQDTDQDPDHTRFVVLNTSTLTVTRSQSIDVPRPAGEPILSARINDAGDQLFLDTSAGSFVLKGPF